MIILSSFERCSQHRPFRYGKIFLKEYSTISECLKNSLNLHFLPFSNLVLNDLIAVHLTIRKQRKDH